MKIGITCHTTAGGSGIMATELGIAMANRGHEVHFVTSERPFRLTGVRPNIVCHTVNPVAYPLFQTPPVALALASRISEVAEEYGIDVWHAHYAMPNAICAILARDMLPPEARFKLVTTLHGTDITLVGGDLSFFRITKYAMENSDAITAVSDWLAKATREQFQLERDVRTIYNFLDPDKFPSNSTERCTLAEDNEKIVMHISNFRPVKRVTDVVRTFKKISEQVNAILVMVGDGPERIAASSVGQQLGVADRIKFLGIYEDIENILPCADLIFQPSEHESFGLVPLEAMSCGIPVLGTNSGGIVEVVEHGETGFLAEVGDTEAMAEYAIRILKNEALSKEMGDKGRLHAARRFAKDPIIDQYESLYHGILET